jgi:hypothetical protein
MLMSMNENCGVQAMYSQKWLILKKDHDFYQTIQMINLG